MPTVLLVGQYRFFFYSDEGNEPSHIHVEAAEKRAKFWLIPIELVWNAGFRSGELKEILPSWRRARLRCYRSGMIISSYDPEFVPTDVRVDDEALRLTFSSGLQVATPVSRFPRLERATPEQRKVWRLIGKGDGIHWPEIDEDISVKGLFSSHLGPISHPVEEIPKLIGELYKTTRRLNELFRGRPFTPDGHLVGSIGEVVAEYIYELKLERCSTPQVDAHTADGRTVQVKLTGEHGRSYGIRWSSRTQLQTPDLLLCLKLTREGFSEVYNGPFPIDLLQRRADQKNGQVALTVKRLSERNPSLLPKTHSFASINRWFSPQLTDVA